MRMDSSRSLVVPLTWLPHFSPFLAVADLALGAAEAARQKSPGACSTIFLTLAYFATFLAAHGDDARNS